MRYGGNDRIFVSRQTKKRVKSVLKVYFLKAKMSIVVESPIYSILIAAFTVFTLEHDLLA